MDKYKNDLFIDGTFYIAPKNMSYQILITYVNDALRNISFMTSWSLLSGKSSDDYFTALKEINKNVMKISADQQYYPKYCHSDYEIAIWSSCK